MAIRIDNSEAQAKMNETKKQLQAVTAEMQKLNDQGQKNTKEYRELKKKQDELNTSLYRQRLEAGRSALTYNELRQGASRLRRAMNDLKPGTAEWKQYREELRLTQQRMRELQGTSTQTGLSIGKLADGFNRYMGLAAGAVASITGMTLTMRQCVDEYAKMEEAESQVIKYTGMTREEVKQLNEQFKAMDTRTSREELNRLAGEAGKLGITGVDNVREFVEAADMINVALGEDLGEDAVNQIGKLSQMFGDSSRSLKENMLAIGSAVNQVAQSSSASEPYLVSFTARMGGVGKQANMAVTDIMGYASALDQNMLRSEMASTALSGLILRLYQEPAKYAKLARMDVQQFTDLMQRDANAAVLMFLESLSKMGGMANIAPVLKEMSLTGAEAASVITTLAGNIDLIRKEQENANQAFREGTSIGNEYNVQNNTVQAQLEKARKGFQEVRIELGERLQPVMKNMISFGSLTVKGLLELIRIYNEYKAVILTTITAVAAYTVTVKAHTIATKAYELATKTATLATKLFNSAVKAGPWGVVIAGVTAVVSYFTLFRDETDKTTSSQKALNDELERTNEVMNRIDKIKVSAENMQFLNDRQKQQLKADAQREIESLDDLISQGMIANKQWYESEKKSLLALAGDNEILQKSYMRSLELDLRERMEVIAGYLERQKELRAIIAKIPDPDTGSSGGSDIPADSDFQARQAALEQQYRTELNLLKEKYLDEKLTQEEYQRQMAASELAYLEMRKSLYIQFGQDASGIQGQIYDKMIAEADRRYQEEKKLEEEVIAEQDKLIQEANKQIEDYKKQDKESKIQAVLAESDYGKQVDMLKVLYDKDIINYREYQRLKTEIAESHEDTRLAKAQQAMQYVSQAAQAGSQLIQALQDREISKVEQRYDKQIEEAQKAGKDTTKLEEEKEAAVSEIKKKYADKQFAMNILQIVSDTAAGIMRGYATLGPILGSIYAAIIAAQGAAQVVVAQQQREEAKGLYTGGYSDEYAQGYTRKGNPHDTAGVIPVHKNEFVANHDAVANPAVKQFLDVFDLAQKRGTIRMLNTTQILEQVRIGKGRYQGGYAGNDTGPSRSSALPLAGMTAEQRSQVVVLLQENNRLLTILTEKELVVDPRKVRDGIKHIEMLERNISR